MEIQLLPVSPDDSFADMSKLVLFFCSFLLVPFSPLLVLASPLRSEQVDVVTEDETRGHGLPYY